MRRIILLVCWGFVMGLPQPSFAEPVKWPTNSPQAAAEETVEHMAAAVAPGEEPVVFSLVGDRDDFGFNGGAKACVSFDKRAAGDHPAFDVSRDWGFDQCHYTSGWVHTFTPPPGGVGVFTIRIPEMMADDATGGFLCYITECGCDNAEKLWLDGYLAPGFLPTGGSCTSTAVYKATIVGQLANEIAGDGTITAQYVQEGDEFALDYAEIVDVWGPVEARLESGNGQTGVIGSPVELPLAVQLYSADPNVRFKDLPVDFQIVAYPRNAAGMTVAANETEQTMVFTAKADASGIARATLVLGDKEGRYTIEARSGASLTRDPVVFVAEAKKPSMVQIIRDGTSVSSTQPKFTVSPVELARFRAMGLDATGQKIGPIKCEWKTAGGGKPGSRGAGTLTPNTMTSTTVFDAERVGKLVLEANTAIAGGIPTAKAELYVTGVFVRLDTGFTPANPQDQLDLFVPGTDLNGASVLPDNMPQRVYLHVPTPPSVSGRVTFELAQVTSYPGKAMNYSVGTAAGDPDMYMDGSGVVDFDPAGNTVAALLVNDYAAYGELTVTIETARKKFVIPGIQIPIDRNGNRIADHGWIAQTASIADTALGPGRDEDDTPVMRLAIPNDGYGAVGDNLSNFEEYRGFIVFGEHRRTNPFHKDYFVEAADFGNDIGFAYPALPTATHRVSVTDYNGPSVVNFNHQGLPGEMDAWPDGHNDQKVVHVVKGGDHDAFFGFTDCIGLDIFSPCVPNYGNVAEIFEVAIADQARADGITDPALISRLRKSTVLHECGHAVNLWHNKSTSCVMYGYGLSDQGGWSNIPSELCTHVDTEIFECTPCGPPDWRRAVTDFNEADTLRFKGDPRFNR